MRNSVQVDVITSQAREALRPITRPIARQIERANTANALVGWAADTALVSAPSVQARPVVAQSVIDRLSVMASSVMARPVGKLAVLENCGRVILCQMWPYSVQAGYDPVLPLALVPLSDAYGRRLQQYANVLLSFPSTRFQHEITAVKTLQGWHNQAVRRCWSVLDMLRPDVQKFSLDELVYLVLKLQVACALPLGSVTMHNGVESRWLEDEQPAWPSELYARAQRERAEENRRFLE